MTRVERTLIIILAALCVAVLAGTVYAFMNDIPARKAARLGVPAEEARDGIYEGIGRIRARTADGAAAIVTIVFPYDEKNGPFKEELASKRTKLRALAVEFFSSRTGSELSPLLESSIKASLRDMFNAELLLGKVDALYFADFQVVP